MLREITRSQRPSTADKRLPGTLAIAVLLGSMLLSATVSAQEPSYYEQQQQQNQPQTNEGVHEHDGFLLRLALGFGYEGLTVDDPTGDTSIGGAGAFIDIAIGGVVIDNLAVNADLFGTAVVSPSVSVDGSDLGDAGDTTLMFDGLGIGVTYYIMPINIYLAGSVGIGFVSLTVEGEEAESDVGFATNLMVGKEWWVGDDWGVGVAGQFLYSAVPRADIDATMPFMAGNLMFTATYN